MYRVIAWNSVGRSEPSLRSPLPSSCVSTNWLEWVATMGTWSQVLISFAVLVPFMLQRSRALWGSAPTHGNHYGSVTAACEEESGANSIANDLGVRTEHSIFGTSDDEHGTSAGVSIHSRPDPGDGFDVDAPGILRAESVGREDLSGDAKSVGAISNIVIRRRFSSDTNLLGKTSVDADVCVICGMGFSWKRRWHRCKGIGQCNKKFHKSCGNTLPHGALSLIAGALPGTSAQCRPEGGCSCHNCNIRLNIRCKCHVCKRTSSGWCLEWRKKRRKRTGDPSLFSTPSSASHTVGAKRVLASEIVEISAIKIIPVGSKAAIRLHLRWERKGSIRSSHKSYRAIDLATNDDDVRFIMHSFAFRCLPRAYAK